MVLGFWAFAVNINAIMHLSSLQTLLLVHKICPDNHVNDEDYMWHSSHHCRV